MSRWKTGLAVLSTIFCGLLVFLLLLALVPVTLEVPKYEPNPAENFEESLSRFEDLAKRDDEQISEVCKSRLHHQNKTTDKVIVLFHGMYNCPKQHDIFAQKFIDQGYNVLIPRIPYNGYQDTYTSALENMTPEVLISFTREIIDLARGLGDDVVVFGLSTSGNMVAWAVQNLEDIDRAVILSPFLAIKNVPLWANDYIGNIFSRVHNIPMQYIDPFGGGRDGDMNYAYKGHNTRAIGHNLAFAREILTQAENGAVPKAGGVIVITNAADEAVENQPAKNLVELWRVNGYENVEFYEFSEDLGLIHDTIDPRQPDGQVEIVYPIVEDYLVG